MTVTGAWISWVGRWTAEEGRHAIVLRDYLTVTRNIDPVALERGRMTQLQTGLRPRRTGYAPRPGLRHVPGARDADRPPQHRPLLRRPGRRPDHGPDRRRREPPHGLLPRHPVGRARRSSRRPPSGRSSTRSSPSRCPAPGSRASCGRRPRSPRPASTTCASTATRSSCRSSTTGGSFELTGLDAAAEDARRKLAAHLEQLDQAARRFEERLAGSTVPRMAPLR